MIPTDRPARASSRLRGRANASQHDRACAPREGPCDRAAVGRNAALRGAVLRRAEQARSSAIARRGRERRPRGRPRPTRPGGGLSPPLPRPPPRGAVRPRAGRRGRAGGARPLAGGAAGQDRALDVQARQQPVEPRRDPPGARADDVQHGGQQQAAHDERVEEHGAREAEAELLDDAVFAEHERQEHAHHDRRGRGHHAAGQREALGDGARVSRVCVQRSCMREIRNTS